MRRILLVIFLYIFAGGCDKPCTYPTRKVPYPYDLGRPLCKGNENPTLATLKSSSGLMETVRIEGIVRADALPGEDPNCGVHGEELNLHYASTLYSNDFNIIISQTDSTRFHLDEGEHYSSIGVNLTDTTSGPVYFEGEYVADSVRIEVLTSVGAGGIFYSPVYKISNLYTARHGEPADIVTYYLQTRQGLIRFDQKDGIYWEVDF